MWVEVKCDNVKRRFMFKKKWTVRILLIIAKVSLFKRHR